jgi:hypothetical protein
VSDADDFRDVPECLGLFSSRAALIPPAVAFDLRDQLEQTSRSYTELSMPKDTNDG